MNKVSRNKNFLKFGKSKNHHFLMTTFHKYIHNRPQTSRRNVDTILSNNPNSHSGGNGDEVRRMIGYHRSCCKNPPNCFRFCYFYTSCESSSSSSSYLLVPVNIFSSKFSSRQYLPGDFRSIPLNKTFNT